MRWKEEPKPKSYSIAEATEWRSQSEFKDDPPKTVKWGVTWAELYCKMSLWLLGGE